jgi:hypothetical protein
VSAIILHSEKPSDLLRRRKIKKELLFKYLNAKRVGVDSGAAVLKKLILEII